MSDVGVAPPPVSPQSAPSAPAAAPQQAEVQINPNPTGSQNPVPPQAPPAPQEPGEKPSGRPPSAREALQKAFAKHRAENPPQPREAKKGDNNPPEDTPDEPLNLKKRPGDQPRERGRFAPRAAADGQAQPSVGAQAGQQATQPGAQAAPQPYRPPPGAPAHHHPLPRMSPRAAADWDKTPDTVRADAHRMYNEVGRAFQQYKGAHDYMQTIRPYVEMAQQQGTTLARVLENHVGIEEKLRSDPIGGLEVIVHNLNLQTQDGKKLTFNDLCWHHLNQSPEQQQLVQGRNQLQALQLQLEQQRREQQALVNEMRRAQYVQRFQMTRGAVDQYADQRPRFNELGDLIHREIQLGFSLDEAYRRAELLRPSTAAQTRTDQTTAAQTRAPNRSISGAPNGGTANGPARNGRVPTITESLEGAIRHVRGGL